jgi:hypothetical protein
VCVAARVVLRAGALEFLACWPGKEHESIVRCEAAAAHVYQALGLIGLVPGHPPGWDPDSDRYGEPAGDLVDISFRWNEDGRAQTADAFAWLREVEYARAPLARPWVFTGSLRLPDGTLSADATGVGIALVDFPDSLIALSRHHSSRNAELWVEANSGAPGAAIPPEGTPVQIVLRPAAAPGGTGFQPVGEVVLDFRGVAWVEGWGGRPARQYCSVPDLADLVRLARRLDPDYVQTIVVRGALRSDESRLGQALLDAGVPAAAIRFRRADPTSRPSVPVRAD